MPGGESWLKGCRVRGRYVVRIEFGHQASCDYINYVRQVIMEVGYTFNSFWVVLNAHCIICFVHEYAFPLSSWFNMWFPCFRIQRLHYQHIATIAAFGEESRSCRVRFEGRDNLSCSQKTVYITLRPGLTSITSPPIATTAYQSSYLVEQAPRTSQMYQEYFSIPIARQLDRRRWLLFQWLSSANDIFQHSWSVDFNIATVPGDNGPYRGLWLPTRSDEDA